MVNWIDEREDDEDGETFECDRCESVFTHDPGATCPVCGEPLADAPDAEAVDALQKCGDEYAEHEGNAT